MSAVAPNTARAMAEHWNGRADKFQRSPSHLRLRTVWSDVFAAAIGVGDGRAIDLGCGTGACALSLAELGYRVTAVDGSEGMLSRARTDAIERGLDVEFIRSDMDGLPLSDGIADVVSIRNVLWTLERPEQAIQLACRMLKPGGTLFVSDGIWRVGENDSQSDFGYRLPNFNGVSETAAKTWLSEAGLSSIRSWQHLFAEHPYGPKYDTDDNLDLIEFFVLTAVA